MMKNKDLVNLRQTLGKVMNVPLKAEDFEKAYELADEIVKLEEFLKPYELIVKTQQEKFQKLKRDDKDYDKKVKDLEDTLLTATEKECEFEVTIKLEKKFLEKYEMQFTINELIVLKKLGVV